MVIIETRLANYLVVGPVETITHHIFIVLSLTVFISSISSFHQLVILTRRKPISFQHPYTILIK